MYARFRLTDITGNYRVLPSDSPDGIRKVYPVLLGHGTRSPPKIFAEPLIKYVYMKLKSIPQINTANNKQMLKKDEYFNI